VGLMARATLPGLVQVGRAALQGRHSERDHRGVKHDAPLGRGTRRASTRSVVFVNDLADDGEEEPGRPAAHQNSRQRLDGTDHSPIHGKHEVTMASCRAVAEDHLRAPRRRAYAIPAASTICCGKTGPISTIMSAIGEVARAVYIFWIGVPFGNESHPHFFRQRLDGLWGD